MRQWMPPQMRALWISCNASENAANCFTVPDMVSESMEKPVLLVWLRGSVPASLCRMSNRRTASKLPG